MTCYDCIHCDVCGKKDGTATYVADSPSLEIKEINIITCPYFKDRSNFIEIPESGTEVKVTYGTHTIEGEFTISKIGDCLKMIAPIYDE